VDYDEPKFSDIFPLSRRKADLLVPLTHAERELLNQAAGDNTAEWARRVLLDAKVASRDAARWRVEGSNAEKDS
jgi:hypothetical protein